MLPLPDLPTHRVPALSVALLDRGRIETATAGAAGPTDVFQAASLGKMLTAWAVLELADQGKIELDAPIGPRLSGFQLPPAPFSAQAVTPYRILSHTAGLSVPDYPGFDPAQPLPSLIDSLAGTGGEVEPVRRFAHAGRFAYSGGGYSLLQLLIEQVTEEPFEAAMRRLVLSPLGLAASDFDPERAPAVTGHDSHGRPLPGFRYSARAAAGLLATAADVGRYLAALLAAPERLARVGTRIAPTGGTEGLWTWYGLGHEIEPTGDVTLIGHHGSNRGWRALAALCPERKAGLVALANSDAGEPVINALLEAWLRALRVGGGTAVPRAKAKSG